MNLIADVAPRCGDRSNARPVDAVAEMGRWETAKVTVGSYRITLQRQILDGALSQSTGFCSWTCGLLAWSGRLRNREQLSRKLGLSLATPLAKILSTAFERWQLELMEHLVGPICVVAVDQHSHRLLWFRDHFGCVPSMRSEPIGERLWLATSLCEFSRSRRVSRRDVHEGRLAKYLLRLDDSDDQDFFNGVKRVKPGTVLVVDLSRGIRLEHNRYWLERSGEPLAKRFIFRRLRRVLNQAVERTVRGSIRPCLSLSSGLDSVTLLGAWVGLQRDDKSVPLPLAGTMAFPHFPGTDESGEVAQLADEWGFKLQIQDMEAMPPLGSLHVYQDFWGYGPCFHPGETYETAFAERLSECFGVDVVISGGAAEYLFAHRQVKPSKGRCRYPSIFRSSALTTLRGARQSALRWLELQSDSLIRNFLNGRLQWWRDKTWRLGNENQAKSDWVIDSWFREQASRMAWRKQLRTGTRQEYPYLTPALFSLAARVPASEPSLSLKTCDRATMRRMVAGVVPEVIRASRKHGLFESFIWDSFVQANDTVMELADMKKLSKLGLVRKTEFVRSWETCKEELLNTRSSMGCSRLGSLAFWTPLSAELWMQAC